MIISNENDQRKLTKDITLFIMNNTFGQILYCLLQSCFAYLAIFFVRKCLNRNTRTQEVYIISALNDLYGKLKKGVRTIVSYWIN